MGLAGFVVISMDAAILLFDLLNPLLSLLTIAHPFPVLILCPFLTGARHELAWMRQYTSSSLKQIQAPSSCTYSHWKDSLVGTPAKRK